MIPEKLQKKIEAFLAERRESDYGGWAQIEDSDIGDLYGIIYDLIAEKCEKDADGDYPIEVRLVNRRKYERMHFDPVPYTQKAATVEDLEPALEAAVYNLDTATSRLESIWRLRRLIREQTKHEKPE